MGKAVLIIGPSGDGKTTSTIINPDGSIDLSKEGYKGMNPESHVILNLDLKELPFPESMWNEEQKNYSEIKDFDKLRTKLEQISKMPKIKSVSIDTLNVFLQYKEFNDRKKMNFDSWRDIANDVLELTILINTILRKDQIAYVFGHVGIKNDINGNERKSFTAPGKKANSSDLEGMFSICLHTYVEYGTDGDNKHYFETKANRSTAKTPLGMFTKDQFLIPNSLKLVDDSVRAYYKI